jgi:outer membrane immunogenic protein
MKMKKKLLVASLLTLAGTGAMAQSAFEGFYAQAGIGYESVTPSFTGGSVDGYGYTATGNNANSFAGTIGAGYNFAVTPSFLLGIGAEYSPIAGSKANITTTVAGIGSETDQYNKKDSYNIFISPSIVIDKDKLAYAKVGYTGANVTSDGDNTSLNGYSLGLGYKQIISGGLYGFGEVNYASYANTNVGDGATGSFSANSTNVLVGLGYKF